ncbi:lipopolysaccharide biosynthesis protein [Carboxylicivirga caseinilyticus]|uniref:lipopolysaccharide biosynthesis protein n=1 Tax=Carboxylicivirga caseinilyticus TaxID=3417572 RepID=UPI003D355B73|nr:hypothetical protein [Marinilabiliaceae bacterium A049]
MLGNRIKKIFILYRGNIVAQALNLVVFFGATYYFPIDIIGTYFIFVAIAEICGSFFSLQSHLTIALANTFKDKYQNWKAGFNIILLFHVLFIVGIIIIYFLQRSFFSGVFAFKLWYFLLPISSLFFGMNQLGEHYLIAIYRYSFVSRLKFIRVVSFSSVVLVFILEPNSINALILGYLVGQITQVVGYYFLAYRRLSIKFSILEVKILLIQFFNKYKHILILNTIVSPINIISNQLPVILLPILYSKSVTANYGIVFKTLLFPVMLFSQVYGQDIYVKASNIFNKKEPLSNFWKLELRKLFIIAIIPFIIIYLISPWFYEKVMGQEWLLAGDITRIILIWMFINFIKTPLASLISILQLQKKWLVFEVFQLIGRLLIFFISYVFTFSVQYTLTLYALISSFAGIILLIYIYYSIGRKGF